jgi:hypothetical protein
MCMSAELGRKRAIGGAAAAAVLAPSSVHTHWILFPVCLRAGVLNGYLWVYLSNKSFF